MLFVCCPRRITESRRQKINIFHFLSCLLWLQCSASLLLQQCCSASRSDSSGNFVASDAAIGGAFCRSRSAPFIPRRNHVRFFVLYLAHLVMISGSRKAACEPCKTLARPSASVSLLCCVGTCRYSYAAAVLTVFYFSPWLRCAEIDNDNFQGGSECVIFSVVDLFRSLWRLYLRSPDLRSVMQADV